MAAAAGDDQNVENRPPRLVVLGASNVARGVGTIVNVTRQEFASPVNFHLAYAHGRSYGRRSKILCWTYPSILECGIWDALERETASSTFGLVTDIGNDILYGASPLQIATWVRQACDRLHSHCQRLAFTQIPLEAVLQLGCVRFHALKSILFPKCRMNLEEVLRRVRKLSVLLNDIASELQITMLKPRSEWYGLDPIHIRSAHQMSAWREYIGDLVSDFKTFEPSNNCGKNRKIRHVLPATWQTFGRGRRCNQPTIRMADGSHLSRY